MNLQQAQLGDTRGISLGGYIPAAANRPRLLDQVLASLASGAGQAVAQHAVEGLLTPDYAQFAAEQGVNSPGVTATPQVDAQGNPTGKTTIEDKRGALSRWFNPLGREEAQRMIRDQSSAAAQERGLDLQERGLLNQFDIQSQNAELQRRLAGLETARTEAGLEKSAAELSRMSALTPLEAEQLAAQNAALRQNVQFGASAEPLKLEGLKLGNQLTTAQTRGATAQAESAELFNAPMRANAQEAALSRYLQAQGITEPEQAAMARQALQGMDFLNFDAKEAAARLQAARQAAGQATSGAASVPVNTQDFGGLIGSISSGQLGNAVNAAVDAPVQVGARILGGQRLGQMVEDSNVSLIPTTTLARAAGQLSAYQPTAEFTPEAAARRKILIEKGLLPKVEGIDY